MKTINRPALLLFKAAVILSITLPLGADEDMYNRVVKLSDTMQVAVSSGREIFFEARPVAGESFKSFGERFLSDPDRWRELPAHNFQKGIQDLYYVRIPLLMVREDLRALCLKDLFPGDFYRAGYWHHRVMAGAVLDEGERVWEIALWFTGDGANFRSIMADNDLDDFMLSSGLEIRIRSQLLLPAFTEQNGRVPLVYKQDRKGEYAEYSLKRGEALYSSVVIRFTGRLDVDEVNELADIIAERSGIKDVTDIPVGYAIKIPKEYLLPEYLPPTDPERIAYEETARETDRVEKTIVTRDLDGIHIILDAGHGGKDPGAMHYGVWEDDYVYDIMCRIRQHLMETTGAKIFITVQDKSLGYNIIEDDKITLDQDEYVQTHPPYRLEKSRTGVNLRWQLVNDIYSRLLREDVEREKILFTSLHADSLHSTVRGTMVYIPGEKFCRGKFGRHNPTAKWEETRRQKPFSFSRQERIRSEGLSSKMAKCLITSCRASGLAIHRYRPVRSYVLRRRAYLPAVLKYNRVPIRILWEVCNLNNREDAKLMRTAAFRQKAAEAYCDALLDFYNGKS
jgi:N-acetylmuramoyl-L-alanine amidase